MAHVTTRTGLCHRSVQPVPAAAGEEEEEAALPPPAMQKDVHFV